MNSLINSYDDEDEDRPVRAGAARGNDREITLGTTMILLIFFALAVYGAVLFGFGYSLGSKHTGTALAASAPPGTGGSFLGGKPSPGSSGITKDPAPAADAASVPFTAPSPAAARSVTVPVAPAAESAEEADSRPRAAVPQVAAPAAAAPPAAAPTPGAPTVVVQVAALSHAEDAELIAGTLKQRGYAVNLRTEPDKLIHVQVGPFSNRKDAEAMKARLLADGFNAYIK